MGKINIVRNAPRKKVGGKEQRASSFSAIDNTNIGKNRQLGLEAKGLYLEMAAVAGTDFDCTAATLSGLSKGKVTDNKTRKTQRLLNELIKAGLVERKKAGMRYEESLGKKVPVYEYTLYEVPNQQQEEEPLSIPEVLEIVPEETAAVAYEDFIQELEQQEPTAYAACDNSINARMSLIYDIGKRYGLCSERQKEYLISAVKRFKSETNCNANEAELAIIADRISANMRANIDDIIQKKLLEIAR